MAARDPYETLGVARDADQDAIRKAYRKLAKAHHPDLNPGDKAAEERFKEAAAAHDLLGDPEKRRRFDAGEIDASGAERPPRQYYRNYADASGADDPYASESGYADFLDDETLASILRGARRRAGPMRGRDVRYRLPVEFLVAVNGGAARVTLPEGETLDVTIPPGAEDGQTLRLRGRGEPGFDGGPAGDALVEIEVRPHKIFTREGDDIHLTLPVSLAEAVLGREVAVPTPTGAVSMKLPKGASSGAKLRLKGKGAARPDGGRGDEYVTLKLVLPEKPDADLEAFVSNWAGAGYDPRAKFGLSTGANSCCARASSARRSRCSSPSAGWSRAGRARPRSSPTPTSRAPASSASCAPTWASTTPAST